MEGTIRMEGFLSLADRNRLIADAEAKGLQRATVGAGVVSDVRTNASVGVDGLLGSAVIALIDSAVGDVVGDLAWATPSLLRYEPGQEFIWHQDNASEKYAAREVTVVCELRSAPGAGLELDGVGELGLVPGEVVFFPSGQWHRATPPTEGVRYSLVTWGSRRP